MSSYSYLLTTENIFRFYEFDHKNLFYHRQCNFRILNPCRRLSPLLGPASDIHKIIHIIILYSNYIIYIYIYIYIAIRSCQTKCPVKFYRHSLALILTQFMNLLLQNIQMIFNTKISATYLDSFSDALVAWRKLLQTVSLNWFFDPVLMHGKSGA